MRENKTGIKTLDIEWQDGVWLGQSRISSEVLMGTSEGVVRAWAVRRRAEEESWNGQAILEMKGTPARPNPNMLGSDVPINIQMQMEAGVPDEVSPPRSEEKTRRLYLKQEDFENHGYTEGCEGCRRLRNGGMAPRAHTDLCRTRVEVQLSQDENPRFEKKLMKEVEQVHAEKDAEEKKEAEKEEAKRDPADPKRRKTRRPRR